jgi:hypothetical protein
VTGHTLEYIVAVSTLAGLAVAAIAVIAGWRTLRTHQRVAKAEFYLKLDEYIREFQEIDIALRKDGSATGFAPDKDDVETWAMINGYMAFFERLQVLADDRIVDRKDLMEFYQYRYKKLLGNEAISARWLTSNKKKYWKLFLQFGETVTGCKGKERVCRCLDLTTGYCKPTDSI